MDGPTASAMLLGSVHGVVVHARMYSLRGPSVPSTSNRSVSDGSWRPRNESSIRASKFEIGVWQR